MQKLSSQKNIRVYFNFILSSQKVRNIWLIPILGDNAMLLNQSSNGNLQINFLTIFVSENLKHLIREPFLMKGGKTFDNKD